MLHTLRFSLQNGVYFIILPCLVPVLFAFYIQSVLKFKYKIPAPKGLLLHKANKNYVNSFVPQDTCVMGNVQVCCILFCVAQKLVSFPVIMWYLSRFFLWKYTTSSFERSSRKVNADARQVNFNNFIQLQFIYKLFLRTKIFWEMTLYRCFCGSRHFEKTYCVHLQGWKRDTTCLPNMGNLSINGTASHSIRDESSTSLLRRIRKANKKNFSYLTIKCLKKIEG